MFWEPDLAGHTDWLSSRVSPEGAVPIVTFVLGHFVCQQRILLLIASVQHLSLVCVVKHWRKKVKNLCVWTVWLKWASHRGVWHSYAHESLYLGFRHAWFRNSLVCVWDFQGSGCSPVYYGLKVLWDSGRNFCSWGTTDPLDMACPWLPCSDHVGKPALLITVDSLDDAECGLHTWSFSWRVPQQSCCCCWILFSQTTVAGGGWAWAFSTWKNGRYLLATDVICVYVFMNESTYEKCLFIGHGLEALDVLINFEGLWSEYSHSYFPVWSEPLWIQSTSTLMPSEHTSKFRLLMCTGWMFLLPHHRYHHHFTPC